MSRPEIDYEIDTTKMSFSLSPFRISNFLLEYDLNILLLLNLKWIC
jgi:hypothetical protein